MLNDMGSLTKGEAAASRLLLLAVHRKGGALDDSTGRLAEMLRKVCGIENTKGNRALIAKMLRHLEDCGTLELRASEGRRRFYGATLVLELGAERISALERAEDADKALFRSRDGAADVPEGSGKDEGGEDIKALITGCQATYAALQDAAARAEQRAPDTGAVAINATASLAAVDITREAGWKFRYYLGKLGLITSLEKVEDTSRLWWWLISDEPLDTARLVELTRSSPYRNRRSRGADPVAPSAESVTGVKPTPPKPSDLDKRRQHAKPPSTTGSGTSDNTVAALASIIEELEEKLIQEKRGRQQDANEHQEEVTKLQTRITALEAEKALRTVDDSRVDAILARHHKKG